MQLPSINTTECSARTTHWSALRPLCPFLGFWGINIGPAAHLKDRDSLACPFHFLLGTDHPQTTLAPEAVKEPSSFLVQTVNASKSLHLKQLRTSAHTHRSYRRARPASQSPMALLWPLIPESCRTPLALICIWHSPPHTPTPPA